MTVIHDGNDTQILKLYDTVVAAKGSNHKITQRYTCTFCTPYWFLWIFYDYEVSYITRILYKLSLSENLITISEVPYKFQKVCVGFKQFGFASVY
jgi:hypothetical protein